MRWQKIAENECRVFLDVSNEAPGPIAMLGYARKFHPHDLRTTDQWMKELREGEEQ